MNDLELITITKEYDETEVVNAVAAYMKPKSAKEHLTVNHEGHTHILQVLFQPPKGKEKYLDACSVKLIFDQNVCRVAFEYQKSIIKTHSNQGMIAGVAAGMATVATIMFAAPLTIPVAAVGIGAALGSEIHYYKKIQKGVMTILETYLCEKGASSAKKAVSESDSSVGANITEDTNSENNGKICSCGRRIEGDMQFCPQCGNRINS